MLCSLLRAEVSKHAHYSLVSDYLDVCMVSRYNGACSCHNFRGWRLGILLIYVLNGYKFIHSLRGEMLVKWGEVVWCGVF